MRRQTHLMLAGGLAALPLLASARLAAAEIEEVVAEVELQGSQRIHHSQVLSKLSTRVGDTVREAALNDDIQRLEALGYFIKPQKRIIPLRPGEVKVVFSVTELPYVGEVRFEGVSFFAQQTLRKKIETRKGNYLSPIQLEVDAQRILAHLRKNHYLHARVEHRLEIEPVSQISTVVFQIHLDLKVKVGRLEFTGLPAGAHRYFLQPRLSNQQGRLFDPDMVTWDRAIVEQFVENQGYLDAEVAEPTVDFFDQVRAYDPRARTGPELVPDGRFNDRAVIHYHVTPGPRYRLGQVRFLGNTVVSEEDLRREFALPEGHLYERRHLDKAQERALALLRNNGYAQARFLQDPVVDRENLKVDLTLYLQEGNRYSVGRMDIFGNTVTKDAVVRRALRLQPGALWSDEARDLSYREIMRSGVFLPSLRGPRSIVPNYTSSRPDPQREEVRQVDVEVDVTEDKTGRFTFNIGFSSAQGIIGILEFSEANFDLGGLLTGGSWRGAGHKLNARASWSQDRQSISLGWRNPHLMDSPYSLGVNLARTDSSTLDWDELRHSASVNVGRRFFKNDLELQIGYGVYRLDIDEIDADASDEALDGEGDYLNHYLRFRQEYDRRNNPRLPTKGFMLDFSQTLYGGLLPADDEFYDIKFSGEAYLPLFEAELGGVTHIRVRQSNRWLRATGDSQSVPFYDRLYGGGSAPEHRGFDDYDLGPFQTNRNGLRAREGGTTEWLTTIELVLPVQGTNEGLRLVTFADIGNIWGRGEDTDTSDLRTGLGIGLRFPVQFPVALDFAWLLDPETGEEDNQFHFSLSGFSF